MTGTALGGALGATTGLGLWLVATRVLALRRPRFELRVLPYIRDLTVEAEPIADNRGAFAAVFGPTIGRAAETLGRLLGGNASIRRRLVRANLSMTLHEFRISQVTWGLVAFSGMAAVSLLVSLRSPERVVPLVVLCVVAFTLGALLRENRLTAVVNQRERRILAEFPTVAELLALAVSAGEGPVAALDRVVSRARGELSADLGRVVADVRTGTPLSAALDGYALRTGLPVVARFAEALAVAVERGTPLAGVLQAQAGDVREAGRRALIESGARREVAMMVPVVFLVLPVTVLFAFWPGVVGLHLVTP